MGSKIKKYTREGSKYGKEITAGLAVLMIPVAKHVIDRLMDRWLGPAQGADFHSSVQPGRGQEPGPGTAYGRRGSYRGRDSSWGS